MIIKAIFVIATNEILYSRSRNDFRTSSNGKCSVDSGFDMFRVVGNPLDYILINLDGDKLLEFILDMDWGYGNSNAEDYKEGFHGRFLIKPNSNRDFYKELVINYNEIAEYFRNY